MATALKVIDQDQGAEPGTDIALAVTADPGIVLLDNQKFDAWYDRLKAEAPTDADVSTKKGQDALRSFAARVRSEKAAIDKARLSLTKGWRDMTAQANEAGKVIEQRLESLAVEVRKPLTDWEEAEKARVADCRRIIDHDIKGAAVVTLDDTAATVRQRGTDVWNIALDAEKFGDMLPEAQGAKEDAVATLKAALDRLTREEADRAELERLRAENEAREAKEREEAEAREREAREAEEARLAEQRRVEAEKAEAERIANAEREAADKVRREAEETAAAVEAKRACARQIIEHIKQVGLGMIGGQTYPYGILIRELEEKIEIDDSLGDMQDEVRTIRDATLVNVKAAMEREVERAAQQEREEEERRLEEEKRKREADQAHRTKVKTDAKTALMTCGADEETARKIVMAILAGEVPHVSLSF